MALPVLLSGQLPSSWYPFSGGTCYRRVVREQRPRIHRPGLFGVVYLDAGPKVTAILDELEVYGVGLILIVCGYVFQDHGESEVVTAIDDGAGFGNRWFADEYMGGRFDRGEGFHSLPKLSPIFVGEVLFQPKIHIVHQHRASVLQICSCRRMRVHFVAHGFETTRTKYVASCEPEQQRH